MNALHSERSPDQTEPWSDSTEWNQPTRYGHASIATARYAEFPDRNQLARPTTPTLIYVVDECPGLAELARAILKTGGFAARAFNDRIRAWRSFIFAEPRPTLLVTDDLGGELPGIELVRRCRKLEPNLKTLWISHRRPTNLTMRDRALLDGFQPRPYCNPLLVDSVRRLCGSLYGWDYLRSLNT
jgi:hypothetical protein